MHPHTPTDNYLVVAEHLSKPAPSNIPSPEWLAGRWAYTLRGPATVIAEQAGEVLALALREKAKALN